MAFEYVLARRFLVFVKFHLNSHPKRAMYSMTAPRTVCGLTRSSKLAGESWKTRLSVMVSRLM